MIFIVVVFIHLRIHGTMYLKRVFLFSVILQLNKPGFIKI